MNTTINLDNNFILEIGDKNKKISTKITDINKLNFLDIKNKKVLILKIDFLKLEKKSYKRILKHLLLIKSLAIKDNIEIGTINNTKILIGYLFNYDKENADHKDFISAINAIFYNIKYERYNYIYDTVCNYLDSYFYGKNLCDFQNNKCGEKKDSSTLNGCCHHFRIKALGPFTKLILCEHLNKETYTCNARCISCKLFTCDYLERKGIKFKIKDILLLNVFFNPLQKYFIKYMVFTPKEKILKRLMFFS